MRVIFILSAILLIEQSLGGTVASTQPSYELTPYGQVFRDEIISKFAALADEPIKLAKKLVADTYADDSNKVDPRITTSLAAFISQFDKVDTLDEAGKIEAFLGYIVIFDLVNGVAIDDAEEKELFQDLKVAFEKYNFRGVVSDLKSKFDEFVAWLPQEIETRGDKLTTQEKDAVKSFRELCQRFEAETDFKKKDALADVIVAKIAPRLDEQ